MTIGHNSTGSFGAEGYEGPIPPVVEDLVQQYDFMKIIDMVSGDSQNLYSLAPNEDGSFSVLKNNAEVIFLTNKPEEINSLSEIFAMKRPSG